MVGNTKRMCTGYTCVACSFSVAMVDVQWLMVVANAVADAGAEEVFVL